MNIPMSSPDLTQAERDAVAEVLQTPDLSNGPRTRDFESVMSDYMDGAHAVAVSSGTSGLHMCMIAAGVQENDLVITTPFSFVASSNVILYERGIPVFVDVEDETGNIDAELVQEAVADLMDGGAAADRWLPPAFRGKGTSGRLRALLPVHVFGQPADMVTLGKVAADAQLTVIEDACEALGAKQNGGKAGSFGEAGVFAFYPNKQMTTGEGGMVVTHNEEWDAIFRSLRNQGRDVFDAWLSHSRLGYNYRMDELSAAMGAQQLRRIEELLEKRSRVADWYAERLGDIEGVTAPKVVEATERMSWFVYVVRLANETERTRVMNELGEIGIPARPYFSPIHLQPFYAERFGYQRGQFPVTERLGDTSLALPFSGVMEEGQVDAVCDALRRIVRP